jgi:hypothetical protein
MKSLYLNKEILISRTEGIESDNFCTSHEELEKALIDADLKEQHIVYNYEFIKTEKDHAIALCTISDKNGRRIQSVGESKCADCEVATDAAKKAFDKATIAYFNFEENVILDYAAKKDAGNMNARDLTIVESKTEEKTISSENIELAKTESDSISEKVTTATIKVNEEVPNIEAEEIRDTKIQITTTVEDEPQNYENKINDINNTSDNDDIGNTLITIGKYAPVEEKKGNNGEILVPGKKAKTIKEIYEEDRKWFDYICEKFTKPGKNPEHLEQANAMREYAKKHN